MNELNGNLSDEALTLLRGMFGSSSTLNMQVGAADVVMEIRRWTEVEVARRKKEALDK